MKPVKPLCEYYDIRKRKDGLADVLLTPAETVPIQDELTGRKDYGIRVLAVRGIDPDDPQWGGDLEGHIREHYAGWIASAEVMEI